ncbi:ATP-binding protein, partial [Streptomyces lavendulae]|uniref:ATP-binding protein n=1 Tax=Streptomyces lavendulae TaxID=1914 RepID=UPI0036BD063A
GTGTPAPPGAPAAAPPTAGAPVPAWATPAPGTAGGATPPAAPVPGASAWGHPAPDPVRAPDQVAPPTAGAPAPAWAPPPGATGAAPLSGSTPPAGWVPQAPGPGPAAPAAEVASAGTPPLSGGIPPVGWAGPAPAAAPGAGASAPGWAAQTAPAAAAPGNLRARLTSFVGREGDIRVLGEDLGRARLVTLLGPGGAGKTRLSQEAAEWHAPRSGAWPDGVWLVELAPVDDPEDVAEAALAALGARETKLRGAAAEELRTLTDRTGDAPLDRLAEHCSRRRLLLLLDNCEHVVGAAAELAERLLTHCPGVQILATSREPLGVPGEFLRPVEPLPDPVALSLLDDRGAAARPGFSVAEDPEAAAEICRRLDGLPLAIELAAARLRLLTPRQIADRLDDRFRLLTGGARTVMPRQQTLRAVVDWSWDLLDASERAVLARLSVFAGGCDLAAAEAVCAEPDGTAGTTGTTRTLDVADVLGSLVDKSLVLSEPDGDESAPGMRYRMLETIHEYAAERAAADPAALDAAARRHAAHYLAFVERAEPLMRSQAQLPWIRRVETELDNLRTALDTTLGTATPEATESAQRIALALGWFWWLRDYRGEGVAWIGRILDRTPADGPEGSRAYWNALHLRILHMFLLAESNRGDHFRTPEYRALAGRIKDVFRRDAPESVRFPGMLWPALGFLTGETADFLADLDQGVANARRHAGDWELGVILMFRAHTAIDTTGGLSTVDADLAELHRIASRVGDRWTRAQVASAAGEMALSRGRYDEARAEYEECLRLAREVGAHSEVPFALARIAEAVYSGGDLDGAERLLAEAEREAERQGGLYDVVAFARLLTAVFALRRGDAARARTACDEARTAGEGITGPAQFAAGLATVEAALLAREQGPEAGLAQAAQGLADAVAARCAERFLAALAETAALLLADADRPAESVRVLAAATAWRAGQPRSVPEEAALEGLPARTRALLGAAAQAGAEAEGRTLTPAEVAALLAAPAALSGS